MQPASIYPPWINIHTHHKPNNETELVIRNAYNSAPLTLLPLGYYFSCGIHPWFATQNTISKSLAQIERSLTHKNCLALGECGLDRLRGPKLSVQQLIFDAHIKLAKHYNKPLIIHSVRAHSEVIAMMRQNIQPAVIHGFNGGKKALSAFLDQGFRISVGHRLLMSPAGRECILHIPLEMLYFETDTQCMPVRGVYETFARLAHVELNTLRQQIWTNFTRDFITDYGS